MYSNPAGTLTSSLCLLDLELGSAYLSYLGDRSLHFAKIAQSLNNLMRKEKKWKWGVKQLKTVFTSQPLLVAPDIGKEYRVEADASDFAIGGVLLIKCKDNMWRLVTYISKSLNETEQNYKIHDKEMLAVI